MKPIRHLFNVTSFDDYTNAYFLLWRQPAPSLILDANAKITWIRQCSETHLKINNINGFSVVHFDGTRTIEERHSVIKYLSHD